MKIGKKGICIIVSLALLMPLVFATSQYYPGMVRRVVPDDASTSRYIDYSESGDKLVIMLVITVALLTIVWLGIYEKDMYKDNSKKKKT